MHILFVLAFYLFPNNTLYTGTLPEVCVEGISCETENNVNLLSALITLEADGEDYIGKRLVADVVVNRVNNPHYPSTIDSVIIQPSQFAKFTNSRYKCRLEHDKIALEAIIKGSKTSFIYFMNPKIATNKRFVSWGLSRKGKYVGNHYFFN